MGNDADNVQVHPYTDNVQVYSCIHNIIHNLLLNNLPFLLPLLEDFARKFEDNHWSDVLSPLLIVYLSSHGDTPQGWGLMRMPQTFVRY